MIRAVVDTNVLISALISKKPSPPLNIYNLLKSADFLLITSPAILEELEEVINRKTIIKLHKRSQQQIDEILQEIAETSYIVPGMISVEAVKKDPDDDKFIAVAIEGKADYIVSGDKPLLNIKEYMRIKIISPKDFMRLLKTGKQGS